jgi:hypothetical protein
MTGTEIKARRTAEGIPGDLVAQRARVGRTKLTAIERGYVQASADEISRLSVALDELVNAKKAVVETALQVGWPVSAL